MGALFTSGATSGVRQEPTIALSDGTSTVKVYLKVPPGARSPNFALSGAKLVSLKKEGGLYLLEILPEAKANEVNITMLNNRIVTGIPLTVVQPLAAYLIPGGFSTVARWSSLSRSCPENGRT